MGFIFAHWELFAALVAVGALLVLSYQYESLAGFTGSEPTDVVRLVNAGAPVLDLRERAAFDAGHLPQAVWLDSAGLAAWVKAPKRRHERPVVLVTAPGLAALRPARALRQAGFKSVHVLRGGVKAWSAAQLPLAR